MMILVLASMLSTVYSSIADCGADKSLFKIQSLSLIPNDTVVANQNVSLILKYSSSRTITGGTAVNAFTYNYMRVSPTYVDLCSVVSCPLAQGPHDGSTFYIFPSGVKGRVSSKTTWFDINGVLLLCIETVLNSVIKKNISRALMKY